MPNRRWRQQPRRMAAKRVCMKLIQLNIWQGRIIKHVADFLKEQQPDILCMQEVYSSEQRVPNWDNFSSLEILQETLPELKYWFFAPLFEHSVWGRQVTQGNVIASRFPIASELVAFTHGHFVKNEELPPNTRNFQTCEIDANGRKLAVVNHHAYWDKNPAGTPESVKSMEKVVDAIRLLPRPLIMCGDLNVRPETETMQLFNGLLENLSATRKLETTLTQVGAAINNKNQVVCDHILISPEITVNSFMTADRIVSDHKALILDFDLK